MFQPPPSGQGSLGTRRLKSFLKLNLSPGPVGQGQILNIHPIQNVNNLITKGSKVILKLIKKGGKYIEIFLLCILPQFKFP